MNPKAYAWLCTADGHRINLTAVEHTHLLKCLCKHWGPTKPIEAPNSEAATKQTAPRVSDSNIIYVDFSKGNRADGMRVML